MSRKLKNFRLTKKDLHFINNTAKSQKISHTKVIENALEVYKKDFDITIEVNNKFIDLIYNAYYILLPFSFGSLMTYYYLRNSWFFVLFFVIAVLPAILPIAKKEINTLVVG